MSCTGCSKGWRAQSAWSMEYLLGMDGGDKDWVTDYIIDSEEANDQTIVKRATKGKDILNMLSKNKSFRIYDRIATRSSTLARQDGETDLPTDKLELLDDYEAPQAIPENLLSKCGILTNYKWSVLNTPNTGEFQTHNHSIHPTLWCAKITKCLKYSKLSNVETNTLGTS